MVEWLKEYIHMFPLTLFWAISFHIFYHRATKSNIYALFFSFTPAACVVAAVGCLIGAWMGVEKEVGRCILAWCAGSVAFYSLQLIFPPWKIREKIEKNR